MTDEQDTSAYVGVDPMYMNYANETEKPYAGSDQEGIVSEGAQVLEVPFVDPQNEVPTQEWSGRSPGADEPQPAEDDALNADFGSETPAEDAAPEGDAANDFADVKPTKSK